jgi:hypothetical protein
VVENEQFGIVLDEQQMIGQVVSKGNGDARDVRNRPGIKRLG